MSHTKHTVGLTEDERAELEEFLLAAIHRREPDRNYDRKLDGDEEAHLIALACSEPPDGRSDWTLHPP